MDLPEILSREQLKHCVCCDRDLWTEPLPYTIEKAVRRFPELQASETIFAYAICDPCASRYEEGISQHSKSVIRNFFQQYESALRAQYAALWHSEDGEPMQAFEHCAFSGVPVGELEEYQIAARCYGQKLAPYSPAYLISGAVLDQLVEELSAETLDFFENFRDNILGDPPDLEELFWKRPRFVL